MRSSDLGCFLLTLISWAYSADTWLGGIFSTLFYCNNDQRSYSDSSAVSACISQGEEYYTSKLGEIICSSAAWYQSPWFMLALGLPAQVISQVWLYSSGFSEYLKSAVFIPPAPSGSCTPRVMNNCRQLRTQVKNIWKHVYVKVSLKSYFLAGVTKMFHL